MTLNTSTPTLSDITEHVVNQLTTSLGYNRWLKIKNAKGDVYIAQIEANQAWVSLRFKLNNSKSEPEWLLSETGNYGGHIIGYESYEVLKEMEDAEVAAELMPVPIRTDTN